MARRNGVPLLLLTDAALLTIANPMGKFAESANWDDLALCRIDTVDGSIPQLFLDTILSASSGNPDAEPLEPSRYSTLTW